MQDPNQNPLAGMNPAMIFQNSTPVSCTSCDGEFFQQAFQLRTISGIVLGGGGDKMLPLPTFRCADCGTPLPGLTPPDEKSADDDKIIKMT